MYFLIIHTGSNFRPDLKKISYILLSSTFSLFAGAFEASRYYYQAEIINLAKDLFWSVHLAKNNRNSVNSNHALVIGQRTLALTSTVKAMFIMEISSVLVGLLREQFSSLGKQEIIRGLKVQLFSCLLQQDFDFFEKHDMWEQRQIIGNAGFVVGQLLDFPVQCLEAIGRTFSAFVILWSKNKKLSMIVFMLLGIKFGVVNALAYLQEYLESSYVVPDLKGKMNNVWKALTQPSAFLTIRTFGREPEEVSHFSSFLQSLDLDEKRKTILYKIFAPLENFLDNVVEMVVLWAGGRMVIANSLAADDDKVHVSKLNTGAPSVSSVSVPTDKVPVEKAMNLGLQKMWGTGLEDNADHKSKSSSSAVGSPLVKPQLVKPDLEDGQTLMAAVGDLPVSSASYSEELGFGDLSAFLIMSKNAFDSARYLRMRAETLGEQVLEPAEKIVALLRFRPKIGLHGPNQQLERKAASTSTNGSVAVDQGEIHGDVVPGVLQLAQTNFAMEFESLAFENVSFSYPSRPSVKVLNRVSFVIKRGESVGILGQTGAGKSSLLLLMLRVYDVDAGSILLNGRNLKSYSPLWLRKHLFGMVGQDLILLERTIKDNIVYGGHISQIEKHEQVYPGSQGESSQRDDGEQGSTDDLLERTFSTHNSSEDHLRRVMKISECHFSRAQFPQGWHTDVGEYGSKLSGGQKQRVAIARALYKNSQVLLLDEATSALDEGTQARIQESLENIRQKSHAQNGAITSGVNNKSEAAPSRINTIITIAHRLSNFRFSDRLIVLKDGRKVEEGSPAELRLKQGGVYAAYCEHGKKAFELINS